MLLSQFIREASRALEALYPPQEARSLVARLVEEVQGVESWAHVVSPDLEADTRLEQCLQRLLAGEPLQYVTGVQVFYGRRFHVGPGVLIPRPETEILVREACVRAMQMAAPRVLDLCTGSGCIAWSIALEVPGASVTAVDLSEAALVVAREQKPGDLFTNGPSETGSCTNRGGFVYEPPVFVRGDVLSAIEFPGGPFDILTANPPYIRECEKAQMRSNVLDYEPQMALFIPDEDPLLFYRAIAGHAVRCLAPGGWGIVEINETLGPQTAAVFAGAGLQNVGILADFFGKDRFVTFTL